MFKKNKIILSAILVLSFWFAGPANAFSISPLKYSVSLNPGDDKDLVVVVKNDSNSNSDFQPVVMGVQQDSLGRPVFKNNIDVAENWVKFPIVKKLLKSNESKDFVFTITIPKNTPPGAHYLGFGARENSDQNIGGQLMSIITLQVAGTADELLLLEKYDLLKNYSFNKNIYYSLQIKNVGNVDLLTNAQIKIYDFKNKILDTQSVKLGSKLFSKSVRTVESRSLALNKIFWPGIYRSVIVINFGLTNQQIVGSANFWYLPSWSICLVGLIIIFTLLLFKKKNNKHETVS